jgi:hypothetical protein
MSMGHGDGDGDSLAPAGTGMNPRGYKIPRGVPAGIAVKSNAHCFSRVKQKENYISRAYMPRRLS